MEMLLVLVQPCNPAKSFVVVVKAFDGGVVAQGVFDYSTQR